MNILTSILLVGLCGPLWSALAWFIYWLRLRTERHSERQYWERREEPRWRKAAIYPCDWERRRALVFVRDRGICQRCHGPCGTLKCSPSAIWSYPVSIRLIT